MSYEPLKVLLKIINPVIIIEIEILLTFLVLPKILLISRGK